MLVFSVFDCDANCLFQGLRHDRNLSLSWLSVEGTQLLVIIHGDSLCNRFSSLRSHLEHSKNSSFSNKCGHGEGHPGRGTQDQESGDTNLAYSPSLDATLTKLSLGIWFLMSKMKNQTTQSFRSLGVLLFHNVQMVPWKFPCWLQRKADTSLCFMSLMIRETINMFSLSRFKVACH